MSFFLRAMVAFIGPGIVLWAVLLVPVALLFEVDPLLMFAMGLGVGALGAFVGGLLLTDWVMDG